MNLNLVVFIQEIINPKDGAFITNLDQFNSIGTHRKAFYVNGNNKRASSYEIYFHNFRVGHIKIKKLIENKKDIITNIYKIQAYNSIMCELLYYVKGKSLLDYANLLSPNDYEKNDKIMLNYFQ